jgi:hypothetical protein
MNLIADQIAAAYLDLATVMQEPIHLADIRAKVDEPHEKVDAAILAMVKTGFVHLLPDSSRRRNQPEAIAAAITIGREAKHYLAFEDEYFPA